MKEITVPDASRELFLVRRYYHTLTAKSAYQKRYLYFVHTPERFKSVKEYCMADFQGIYPKDHVIKDSKKNKMDVKVQFQMENMLDHGQKNPKIRQELSNPDEPFCTLFTDKQIVNLRHRLKKKKNQGIGNHSTQVQRAISEVSSGNGGIKKVIIQRDGCINPTIVCWDWWSAMAVNGNCTTGKEIMTEMVSFSSTDSHFYFTLDHPDPSILSFDLTFQVGPENIITSAFKLKGVVWKGTNNNPVVLGPIGLVYRATQTEYNDYFRCITEEFEKSSTNPDAVYLLGKKIITEIMFS